MTMRHIQPSCLMKNSLITLNLDQLAEAYAGDVENEFQVIACTVKC